MKPHLLIATLAFVLTGALIQGQTARPASLVIAAATNAVQDYADARTALET